MRLELEWRIPWEPGWDQAKKEAAADKLADYMRKGTFFETQRRMRASEVTVVKPNTEKGNNDPYITFTLEN